MQVATTSRSSSKQRLIVIGGGAAGFFCAVNAARINPSLQVVIVEKTNKLLAKVRISGGGRCNVTHACFELSSLIKKYPRGTTFLKKAFHSFNTTHCVKWFEERGFRLKTEADGRMFSITDSALAIIDCLMREADQYAVQIETGKEVKKLAFSNDCWSLQFADESTAIADYVCIACGGYPKSTAFSWLTQLGHAFEEPVPSLFTFNIPSNPITALMGVSVDNAHIKMMGSKLEQSGPLLITHWGMSGPAILKLSAWGAREIAHKQYSFSIMVNWVPHYNEQHLREDWQQIRNQHAMQKISNKNPFGLPARLWLFLLIQSGINEDIRWADLPAKEQNKLIKNCCSQVFEVKGKTTFKEEFVTCGGIKLNQIDAHTMESKLLPHLFFAGEIMDVDGITGGFNFQHAWTSGWIAANSIATKHLQT